MELINFINDSEPALNAENLNKIQMNVFENIYPVGSIYMNMNDVNPAVIFGGVWERIEARFLIGTGTLKTQNSTTFYGDTPATFDIFENETGGENLTKLTVDQMPAHDHKVYINSTRVADGDDKWATAYTSTHGDIYTTYTGGNQAHNNMPPYQAVYMWKRIA